MCGLVHVFVIYHTVCNWISSQDVNVLLVVWFPLLARNTYSLRRRGLSNFSVYKFHENCLQPRTQLNPHPRHKCTCYFALYSFSTKVVCTCTNCNATVLMLNPCCFAGHHNDLYSKEGLELRLQKQAMQTARSVLGIYVIIKTSAVVSYYVCTHNNVFVFTLYKKKTTASMYSARNVSR